MAEADEPAQQVRRAVEELGVRHDLARQPVTEDDFHGDRTPAQRVTRTVVAAEPQQRVEELTVAILVASPELRGEEVLGQRLAVLLAPLPPLVAGPAVGQLADHPLHERSRGRPCVGLERGERNGPYLDGIGDPRPGVGEHELVEDDVGIVTRR